jgi:hypothetical protein
MFLLSYQYKCVYMPLTSKPIFDLHSWLCCLRHLNFIPKFYFFGRFIFWLEHFYEHFSVNVSCHYGVEYLHEYFYVLKIFHHLCRAVDSVLFHLTDYRLIFLKYVSPLWSNYVWVTTEQHGKTTQHCHASQKNLMWDTTSRPWVEEPCLIWGVVVFSCQARHDGLAKKVIYKHISGDYFCNVQCIMGYN